jgi:uncharacterized protein (UPF0335 family)
MVDVVNNSTKELIKQMVEKIERLENEKQSLLAEIREVYSEAKSQGLDTTALKQLIKLRKLEENQLREQEEILDLYKHAIGMI